MVKQDGPGPVWVFMAGIVILAVDLGLSKLVCFLGRGIGLNIGLVPAFIVLGLMTAAAIIYLQRALLTHRG